MDIKHYLNNGSIDIIVKPNSPKNEIVEWDEVKERLRVNIKAVPDKNKANKEVVKYFSKLIGKKVEIIKGLRSREKTLKVLD